MTSSERRVQRTRKAIDPPEGAKDDIEILGEMARRLGHEWAYQSSEEIWDELRSLSEWHRGMSYQRLEAENGLHWPCPDENEPDSPFLHGRLWDEPVGRSRTVQRCRACTAD